MFLDMWRGSSNGSSTHLIRMEWMSLKWSSLNLLNGPTCGNNVRLRRSWLCSRRMPHEIAAHIINRNVIGTLTSLLLCQNPIEYRRPTRLIVVSIRTFVVGLWRRGQAASSSSCWRQLTRLLVELFLVDDLMGCGWFGIYQKRQGQYDLLPLAVGGNSSFIIIILS